MTGDDGRAVPVTVLDPAGDAARRAPTLLTVYGGFGLPLVAAFDPTFAAWLRAGGRVGWVHARGGGEYGPDWAAAGRPGKARTVADLCAAARTPLAIGPGIAASPDPVAVIAASNGALVAAAALVAEPTLFAAVVCMAPLTDMLRYHHGGLGRLWIEEYGDPEDPQARAELLAYSPYHNVRPGVRYPATLLLTGGNDDRVPAWHAWKLCAALQRATGGSGLFVLDHDNASGHDGRSGQKGLATAGFALAFLAEAVGLDAPEADTIFP